ncbi:MAG: DUF222 domain-containing protein [Oleispira sp.]|nr:DUF222 domain-containing protein [Oleispira sp.]
MFAVNIEDNDQLADEITTLAGQINAANYRFLKLIAEFDRREAWLNSGIRSCAYWLNWKCGIAMNAAREKVRVARALDGLPEINEAFEKGELSFSKVRAMTRIATALNEPYLLMIANHGTAQHMEVLVRAYRFVSPQCDADEALYNKAFDNVAFGNKRSADTKKSEYQQDQRKVSCYQDDDGMWHIQATLPAEEGGLLVKVLKELGDRLVADASLEKEQEIENEKQLSIEPEIVTAVTSFPQRRADALVAIAEHYLATGSGDAVNLKASDRCQLIMHVHTFVGNRGAIAGSLDAGPGANLDGQWLPPDAARRLACDASLRLVKEDEYGNVLDIGRRSRIISSAMSRALTIRDGGCQFPGCCESRYVDGHHIKHWADGGETKLDNLVTLCRYHHRELHKGNYFLCLKPETNTVQRFADRLCFSKVDRYFDAPFNRSDKFVIAATPAKFTCACCDSAVLEKALLPAIYRSINAATAVTGWLGEHMDLSMAIDGLIFKRAAAQDVGMGIHKQGRL